MSTPKTDGQPGSLSTRTGPIDLQHDIGKSPSVASPARAYFLVWDVGWVQCVALGVKIEEPPICLLNSKVGFRRKSRALMTRILRPFIIYPSFASLSCQEFQGSL